MGRVIFGLIPRDSTVHIDGPGSEALLPELNLSTAGRRLVMYRSKNDQLSRSTPLGDGGVSFSGAAQRQKHGSITIPFGGENDCRLEVTQTQLLIDVPLSSVRQLYVRRDAGQVWFADDPRVLVGPRSQQDLRGLLCQLELVSSVAPFSPWKDIRRIAPGTRYCIDFGGLQIVEEPLIHESAPAPELNVGMSRDLTTTVHLLDQALEWGSTAGERRVVLFSGGVDSGLIAARASALGWKDVILAHSSRGADDAETAVAQSMAKELQLRLKVFTYDPGAAMAMLPLMYGSKVPVNDFSALPMWYLAGQVLDSMPDTALVWEGSNADALFGGLKKWQRSRLVYRMPRALRQLIGSGYRLGEYWKEEGKTEKVLRIARRTADWRFPWFALTLHPLAGIAYRFDRAVRREIEVELGTWWDRASNPLSPDVKPKLLGVVFNNCGGHCQKLAAALQDTTARPSYPFLSPPLVWHALEQATLWPAELREGKGALKRLLAEHVSAELVYRQKSGFSVPPARLFNQRPFVDALGEVIETPNGPFAEVLDHNFLRDAAAAVRQRRRLAWYTYEFLWQLVFGHHWMRQDVPRARATGQSPP